MQATKQKNLPAQAGNKPIGVFDSGVGGLSILAELQILLPNENFIFLADQKYVPYGEKSKKELIELGFRVTDYFVKNHDIKMMVIACNTATCSTIEELRARYSFPIVGTVPAVKPAALKTKNKTIAVISTPSTSRSQALKNLIKDNCADIDVLNIGCQNLENVVEKGELNSKEVNNLLLKYLRRVLDSQADYLVLGCTHYPFLKKSIEKIVGPRIKLIDSGYAIAKQTKNLLGSCLMQNKTNKYSKTIYFTTGSSAKFSKVAGKLLKHKVKSKKAAI